MGIDLSTIVRPGDWVTWGQGPGEASELVRALVDQREQIGGITAFLGASFTDILRPTHSDCIRFVGLGGLGTNRNLFTAGVLDVMPCRMSDIPRLLERGTLRLDVVFLHVTPCNSEGYHSLGVVADFLPLVVKRARRVVAQVNPLMPWTFGDTLVHRSRLAAVVECERMPAEVLVDDDPIAERIAAHAMQLVPDGAVIQMGLGTVPEAVVRSLSNHRDLGVHSGLISDAVLGLIEAGVVTNATKSVDRRVTVCGSLFGSHRLYRFADRNPEIQLRSTAYTHDISILSSFDCFVSINSALEVDLTGQVNAEVVDGHHVGAVGGQVDFVQGATLSRRGRAIIALPSTAREGRVSRIVPRLTSGVTTTARCEVDAIVTEHGVAELRGQPIRDRARMLIGIAHPDFRAELERQAFSLY